MPEIPLTHPCSYRPYASKETDINGGEPYQKPLVFLAIKCSLWNHSILKKNPCLSSHFISFLSSGAKQSLYVKEMDFYETETAFFG